MQCRETLAVTSDTTHWDQNSGHFPLQLIARCSSSQEPISRLLEIIVQHERRSKRNASFLRWVKCTKCMQWCDDFSHDYRSRQRYTKMCARTRSASRRRAACRCKQWACGLFTNSEELWRRRTSFTDVCVDTSPPSTSSDRWGWEKCIETEGWGMPLRQDATTEVTRLRVWRNEQ